MITLKVTGMTCGHCEMTVKNALSKVPGVTRVVTVDRKQGQAVVEGTPDPGSLVRAVEGEGYRAEAMP